MHSITSMHMIASTVLSCSTHGMSGEPNSIPSHNPRYYLVWPADLEGRANNHRCLGSHGLQRCMLCNAGTQGSSIELLD